MITEVRYEWTLAAAIMFIVDRVAKQQGYVTLMVAVIVV